MSTPLPISLPPFEARAEGDANSDGHFRWVAYGPTTLRLGIMSVARVPVVAREKIATWTRKAGAAPMPAETPAPMARLTTDSRARDAIRDAHGLLQAAGIRVEGEFEDELVDSLAPRVAAALERTEQPKTSAEMRGRAARLLAEVDRLTRAADRLDALTALEDDAAALAKVEAESLAELERVRVETLARFEAEKARLADRRRQLAA